MEETGFFYSEKDFRQYFEKNYKKFGVKKIQLSHEACPDYVLIMKNGDVVNAEAELFAEQFKYDHKHQLHLVDVVLCCYAKSTTVLGKPVIALHKYYELDEHKQTSKKKNIRGKLSKDEWEMLEFIASYRRVSFAEITSCPKWAGNYLLFQVVPPKIAKGALRGYPKKTNLLDMATRPAIEHMRKYCAVLLATGLSKKACVIYDRLKRRRLISLVPSCFLTYAIDGSIYDTNRWIAMEVMVTDKALKKYPKKLDVFRLLDKTINSLNK